MDLLYFYPEKNDAPAKVGKSIIEELINYKDPLPVDKIKLIINKNENEAKQYNLESVTLLDILNYPNNYVIHIPISPNLMPNKKFLLHIYSIIKQKPLIIHYHGDFRKHIKMQLKYRHRLDYLTIPSAIFAPYLLKYTCQIVTHSYSLNDIIKKKYRVKNSIVIPNGIDNFWFYPLNDCNLSELNHIVTDDNFKIFFHGRLAPEKGIDLLIKAVSKFLKDKPKTVLYIAGEGEYKKGLIKLCEKLKIKDHVIFLGNLNRLDIKFILKNVDLAIYPSRFDTFCLAVMEAFACSNCPVCFSKNAGIYDFVVADGYQLKSFEPNVDDIVEILNSQYTGTDENLVTMQKKFAERYTWNHIIEKYVNLYESHSIQ
ncbi:glycosyltransferase family 4 protein [Methanosarcina sp. WWM596]|uniref:glycosyltransferase family 4 protein n=1 Tax=Methanosarcina sp. WWM596 TaxID=1434103 RepID=UPI0006158F22|nr:glycosyltransferase family 4 protein [Methanosarcina sp. WWM596]AKB17614.1 Glycosyltransferase [Methanosarcina sp. WWM596]